MHASEGLHTCNGKKKGCDFSIAASAASKIPFDLSLGHIFRLHVINFINLPRAALLSLIDSFFSFTVVLHAILSRISGAH